MQFAIHASHFVLADRLAGEGYLRIVDGRVGEWSAERPDCEIVERPGCWVSPGFVDTHIHGFGGHDVMDCDPAGVNEASEELLRHGTTTWLPTTLTASAEDIGRACASVREAVESRGDGYLGARVAGIFLEGPFFTEEHAGAQNPAYMCDASLEIVEAWQDAAGGLIRKCSLAPERAGSAEFVANAVRAGYACALGHSSATYDEGLAAVEAGAGIFVHTYNAMSGLHHREPGLVGLAMGTPDTVAELICDGHHVHPGAIAAMVRAKGWEHVALVSDALRCAGMPDGEYMLGEFPVILQGGAARLVDGGNLAGSVLTLDVAVRNVVTWGIATPEQAMRMASEVPARSAGIGDSCGVLEEGRLADIVVLDEGLGFCEAYLAGRRA